MFWIGVMKPNGYGSVSIQGKKHNAHRVAWELAHGPVPPGMHVCHKCDTPLCVNPDHLFLGSRSDNMQDCVRKGRFFVVPREYKCKGEKNGASKLSTFQVLKIRALQQRTMEAYREAGKEYGVSVACIRGIVQGRTWKHV